MYCWTAAATKKRNKNKQAKVLLSNLHKNIGKDMTYTFIYLCNLNGDRNNNNKKKIKIKRNSWSVYLNNHSFAPPFCKRDLDFLIY